MQLERFRGRMPLIVFVLLALICLLMLGFACACLTDQPAQALERAMPLGTGLPPVVAAWVLLAASFAAAHVPRVGRVRARSRASPALLQRFLF